MWKAVRADLCVIYPGSQLSEHWPEVYYLSATSPSPTTTDSFPVAHAHKDGRTGWNLIKWKLEAIIL